jgi:hypothetical protein
MSTTIAQFGACSRSRFGSAGLGPVDAEDGHLRALA